jgi:hypothetical protein
MSRDRYWLAIGVFLAWAVVGCHTPLVNLSPLEIETWPGSNNQVLTGGDTIRVSFSDPVDHSSTQGLLTVSSSDGTVSGDVSWSSETLVFAPVPALVPGKRYNLEFNGQVKASDGRTFSVAKEVPFFSVSTAPLVKIASFSPAHGASVGLAEPLSLTFSDPIDQATFEAGFSLSPSVTTTKSWSSDGLTVTITPVSAWATNTLYTWQIPSTVTSRRGIPMVGVQSDCYLTNADQSPPQIVSIVPALWVPVVSSWSPDGTNLSALVKGEALLVTTTKPVRLASLQSAFHLFPSVKGHFVAQDTNQYVWVFDEDFSPGATYVIQISTDLLDQGGLALQSPWTVTFTPNIPFLQVSSIGLTGVSTANYTTTQLNQSNYFPVCTPSGVAGSLQVAVKLTFSGTFSAADKAQFAILSFCQPLFPTSGISGLSSPTLVTVDATASNSVILTYQGFSVNATAGAPDYYQIKVPGGLSGLKTSSGQSLKEDVWINFATGL